MIDKESRIVFKIDKTTCNKCTYMLNKMAYFA